ncbi:MAG: cobyrinate a,c-diamide synthase [Alphaproteobacteria bacterium]|nr:cobyrinate a,c-diamide synthase [Alphaproteobacteria bacterium]
MTPGLILAAPASGSGKTTVSLALMRAFHRHGLRIAPAKIGPDYIDPGFHSAACGRDSLSLDAWAMRPETRADLRESLNRNSDLILAEGVMGLFDGAADGTGSTADIAAETGWPVIMILDVAGQSASAIATLRGFATHRPDVQIAGVLFNRVGGARHRQLLAQALAESDLDIPSLGYLPREEGLALKSRHLGLVQAQERPDLEAVLNRAADWVEAHTDLDSLRARAQAGHALPKSSDWRSLPPLGKRIALASDTAFAFSYPHLLTAWQADGAEILPFSPLANEAPAANADAIYLPGGYPELYAGLLAGNQRFLSGLHEAAQRGCTIFGECGGYMVLGESLTDAEGEVHQMAGLLPLRTSFADRRLHLGYRRATVLSNTAPWAKGTPLAGHEFHYATTLFEGEAGKLFQAEDALGEKAAPVGLSIGKVCGSFLHLIDRAL